MVQAKYIEEIDTETIQKISDRFSVSLRFWGWFNIKMLSYQFRNSFYKFKMV